MKWRNLPEKLLIIWLTGVVPRSWKNYCQLKDIILVDIHWAECLNDGFFTSHDLTCWNESRVQRHWLWIKLQLRKCFSQNAKKVHLQLNCWIATDVLCAINIWHPQPERLPLASMVFDSKDNQEKRSKQNGDLWEERLNIIMTDIMFKAWKVKWFQKLQCWHSFISWNVSAKACNT